MGRAQIGGAAVVDIADITLTAVSGRISPLPCSTSDTVDLDTPASRAMSRIVALARLAILVMSSNFRATLLERSNH
jgi:hypothetical protein